MSFKRSRTHKKTIPEKDSKKNIKIKHSDQLVLQQTNLGFDIMLDGNYIGHFFFDTNNKVCEIGDLRLDEEFQRKGIGTKVFSWIETMMRRQGCEKMTGIAVREKLPFWEKMGFVEIPSGLYSSAIVEKTLVKNMDLK